MRQNYKIPEFLKIKNKRQIRLLSICAIHSILIIQKEKKVVKKEEQKS